MKARIKSILIILFLCISSVNLWSKPNDSFEHLDGEWDFYLKQTPLQTFDSIKKKEPADFKIVVPGYWNKNLEEKGITDPKTYGCYRYLKTGLEPGKKYALLVKDAPKTSCAVFVNRKHLVSLGDPFIMVQSEISNQEIPKGSHSKIVPVYCEFYPDAQGNAEIVFFISNYFYRKGGLCDSVILGKVNDISKMNRQYLIFYTLILGSLVFIGLLNLIQFIINKRKLEYLYLAIATFLYVLRIATMGYCSLGIIFPSLTAEIKIKLEYMVIWLAPPAILQMVFAMYPPRHKRVWEHVLRYIIISSICALGVISLFIPAEITNQLVPLFQVCMGIVCTYVVVVCITNIVHHKRYSVYFFLSFLIIIAGAITDVIFTHNRSSFSVSLFPFFLVAYLLIQMLLIAIIQNDLYQQTIKKTDELKRLNEAYLRFVPQEFLTLLNKESVIKTNLGDYQNIEMCIMFSKLSIKCFDEEVALDEHFLIFNEYLKRVSPIIQKYDGFVSKFLSGGFMALFPKSELDAIGAALEIKECVRELNKTEICGHHKIEPFVGIHYGKMIIGTIGETNRMDDTVISDTVNTASRIESVCEKLGKTIIVSRALESLMEKDVRIHLAEKGIPRFGLRPLEAISVKGKEKPLELYEIITREAAE